MTDTWNEKSNIRLTADRPARFRKAVVFCCDDNYLPFATHAASQIATLHPNRDFDLCICTGQKDIFLPESLRPLDLRICAIDVGAGFDRLRIDKGSTRDSYLRIALPLACVGDYERILYLDGDIFVQGGNFSALLDVDMGGAALAAIRDNTQWRTQGRQVRRNKTHGSKDYAYFNSGVLLLDVPAYNDARIMARCLAISLTGDTHMKCHDQNLLNAVLEGDWAELSPMWNWQFSWAARFFAAIRSPHIIHFIGPVKPWKDPLGELEPRFADAMRRFTASHFPEMPFDKVPRGTLAPDSRRMTRMLLKHLLSRRKMARYLARFPDEMTVHR